MADEEYITVEDAADILRVVPRQVNRYGNGPDARLRTRKAGRRVLYHRGDVETLADDLGVVNKPQTPRTPASELVPQGKVLEEWRLREREHQEQINELHAKLNAAAHRIGELEAQLQHRLSPEQERALRDELAAYKTQLSGGRPWWKRLLGQ
jgi:hypothetical protein